MILTYANLTEAPVAYPARAAFSRSTALIGDSLIFDALYEWKNVTFPSGTGGIDLSVGFTTGQGITADAVGTGLLEFRASDDSLRWTAPSDTAGAWVPIFAGWNTLESGTAGKGIRFGVQSIASLPGTDQSIAVSVTGVTRYSWWANGFGARMMHELRWLCEQPKFLGIGGNATWEVIEQLPWIETQSSGPGYDVIELGTNDVSAWNGTTVTTAITTANYETILDARVALGRRIVIVGMPARWGTAVDTPMTSDQQAMHEDVNDWLEAWADANDAIFVDTYALTYDSGETDRRPAAGMLRDHVHPSDMGAQIIGNAVADAVAAVTGRGVQRGSDSTGNLLGTQGYMAGTSGTASTGVTGTAPTGWTIARASGSDVTATASVEDRVDGVAGRRMVLDVAATSGGQVMQASNGNKTLASLGLAVGDTVYMEAELEISDVTGGLVECDAYVRFVGASPTADIQALRYSTTADRQLAEESVRRSPRGIIPTGTTNLRFYLWIRTQDAATATVKMASAAIIKVA